MTITSTAGASFAKTAGLLCLVGAATGVISGLVTAFIPPQAPSELFRYPFTPGGFQLAQLVFMLNHLLLLAGILGLGWSGAAGSGLVGRAGVSLAAAGMVALTLSEVAALSFVESRYPGRGTDLMDAAFGVSTILIGVGLVLAGVAVMRAGQWVGWRRLVPLTCGVAVFVIVIPGVFGPFLAGRLVLVVWMLMFAALGWALYARPRSADVDHGPVATLTLS